jgi:hypothetical protein
MATGDQTDMLARIKAVLPADWFPLTAAGQASATPILDGVLSGVAWSLAFAYSLLQYAQAQTRILTSTDVFLDLISLDYFGTSLPRKASEGDAAFQARILAALLPDGATRAALIAKLTALTGHAPKVFEPRRPADTGGYNTGYLGWGVAGGWGDMNLPYQCFVTAYRPSGGGIALMQGWGTSGGTYAAGGWGTGLIEYADRSMIQGQITDADIEQAVAAVIPEGTIAWMNITNAP